MAKEYRRLGRAAQWRRRARSSSLQAISSCRPSNMTVMCGPVRALLVVVTVAADARQCSDTGSAARVPRRRRRPAPGLPQHPRMRKLLQDLRTADAWSSLSPTWSRAAHAKNSTRRSPACRSP